MITLFRRWLWHAVRWLWHAAAAGLLVLCLFAAAMWARSHFRYDTFRLNRVSPFRMIHSVGGSLTLDQLDQTFLTQPPSPTWLAAIAAEPRFDSGGYTPDSGMWAVGSNALSIDRFGFAGFRFRSQGSVWWAVVVPWWCFVALGAPLPAVWVRRLLASRRTFSANLCRGCGYDLRGSARDCPECGASPRVA